MQAEGKLEPGEEARYRSTYAAVKQILKDGGVRALYVGVGPTVKRAAILTATQVVDVEAGFGLVNSYCNTGS